MRVLHISSEKTWRGGEQQIAYLIQGAQDIEHFVFCRSESLFEEYCKAKEIPYESGSFFPLNLVWSAKKMIVYCRDNSVKLVHCHTGKALLLGYMAILMGLNIPVVASRRIATRPSDSLLTRARYNHSQVRRIICVSDSIRQTMANYLSDPSKTITIYSGIDPDRSVDSSFDLRKKLQIGENKVVIGTVAALTEEKDLPTFLDTAKKILNEESNVHFVIVGDGDQRESLEKRARALDIDQHVSFTGYVDRPLDYLHQFDEFLFTSKNEGLGTSILDAFACGVPVIASETGGIPELVRQDETGILVTPGNSDEFARSAIALMRNQKDSSRLTINATNLLESFTYHEMARQTARCYQKVIQEI